MRRLSNTPICGVPARDLSDLFSYYRSSVNVRGAASRLNMSEKEAAVRLSGLVAERYLTAADKDGWHELREPANAVRLARFMKPISRARADEIAERLVERAEAVNDGEELVYFVEKAIVFGSYADPTAPDVGDIDLALKITLRPPLTKPVEASLERAKRSGRTFRNYLEELTYGEAEVRRLIQNRSRYISIHGMEDLKLAKHTRLLFKADSTKVRSYRLDHDADPEIGA